MNPNVRCLRLVMSCDACMQITEVARTSSNLLFLTTCLYFQNVFSTWSFASMATARCEPKKPQICSNQCTNTSPQNIDLFQVSCSRVKSFPTWNSSSHNDKQNWANTCSLIWVASLVHVPNLLRYTFTHIIKLKHRTAHTHTMAFTAVHFRIIRICRVPLVVRKKFTGYSLERIATTRDGIH